MASKQFGEEEIEGHIEAGERVSQHEFRSASRSRSSIARRLLGFSAGVALLLTGCSSTDKPEKDEESLPKPPEKAETVKKKQAAPAPLKVSIPDAGQPPQSIKEVKIMLKETNGLQRQYHALLAKTDVSKLHPAERASLSAAQVKLKRAFAQFRAQKMPSYSEYNKDPNTIQGMATAALEVNRHYKGIVSFLVSLSMRNLAPEGEGGREEKKGGAGKKKAKESLEDGFEDLAAKAKKKIEEEKKKKQEEAAEKQGSSTGRGQGGPEGREGRSVSQEGFTPAKGNSDKLSVGSEKGESAAERIYYRAHNVGPYLSGRTLYTIDLKTGKTPLGPRDFVAVPLRSPIRSSSWAETVVEAGSQFLHYPSNHDICGIFPQKNRNSFKLEYDRNNHQYRITATEDLGLVRVCYKKRTQPRVFKAESPEYLRQLTATLPPFVRKQLDSIKNPTPEKIRAKAKAIMTYYMYTVNFLVNEEFQKRVGHGKAEGYLQAVWQLMAADCDVLASVYYAMMRYKGEDCRIVHGFSVKGDGNVTGANAHGWIEYANGDTEEVTALVGKTSSLNDIKDEELWKQELRLIRARSKEIHEQMGKELKSEDEGRQAFMKFSRREFENNQKLKSFKSLLTTSPDAAEEQILNQLRQVDWKKYQDALHIQADALMIFELFRMLKERSGKTERQKQALTELEKEKFEGLAEILKEYNLHLPWLAYRLQKDPANNYYKNTHLAPEHLSDMISGEKVFKLKSGEYLSDAENGYFVVNGNDGERIVCLGVDGKTSDIRVKKDPQGADKKVSLTGSIDLHGIEKMSADDIVVVMPSGKRLFLTDISTTSSSNTICLFLLGGNRMIGFKMGPAGQLLEHAGSEFLDLSDERVYVTQKSITALGGGKFVCSLATGAYAEQSFFYSNLKLEKGNNDHGVDKIHRIGYQQVILENKRLNDTTLSGNVEGLEAFQGHDLVQVEVVPLGNGKYIAKGLTKEPKTIFAGNINAEELKAINEGGHRYSYTKIIPSGGGSYVIQGKIKEYVSRFEAPYPISPSFVARDFVDGSITDLFCLGRGRALALVKKDMYKLAGNFPISHNGYKGKMRKVGTSNFLAKPHIVPMGQGRYAINKDGNPQGQLEGGFYSAAEVIAVRNRIMSTKAIETVTRSDLRWKLLGDIFRENGIHFRHDGPHVACALATARAPEDQFVNEALIVKVIKMNPRFFQVRIFPQLKKAKRQYFLRLLLNDEEFFDELAKRAVADHRALALFTEVKDEIIEQATARVRPQLLGTFLDLPEVYDKPEDVRALLQLHVTHTGGGDLKAIDAAGEVVKALHKQMQARQIPIEKQTLTAEEINGSIRVLVEKVKKMPDCPRDFRFTFFQPEAWAKAYKGVMTALAHARPKKPFQKFMAIDEAIGEYYDDRKILKTNRYNPVVTSRTSSYRDVARRDMRSLLFNVTTAYQPHGYKWRFEYVYGHRLIVGKLMGIRRAADTLTGAIVEHHEGLDRDAIYDKTIKADAAVCEVLEIINTRFGISSMKRLTVTEINAELERARGLLKAPLHYLWAHQAKDSELTRIYMDAVALIFPIANFEEIKKLDDLIRAFLDTTRGPKKLELELPSAQLVSLQLNRKKEELPKPDFYLWSHEFSNPQVVQNLMAFAARVIGIPGLDELKELDSKIASLGEAFPEYVPKRKLSMADVQPLLTRLKQLCGHQVPFQLEMSDRSSDEYRAKEWFKALHPSLKWEQFDQHHASREAELDRLLAGHVEGKQDWHETEDLLDEALNNKLVAVLMLLLMGTLYRLTLANRVRRRGGILLASNAQTTIDRIWKGVEMSEPVAALQTELKEVFRELGKTDRPEDIEGRVSSLCQGIQALPASAQKQRLIMSLLVPFFSQLAGVDSLLQAFNPARDLRCLRWQKILKKLNQLAGRIQDCEDPREIQVQLLDFAQSYVEQREEGESARSIPENAAEKAMRKVIKHISFLKSPHRGSPLRAPSVAMRREIYAPQRDDEIRSHRPYQSGDPTRFIDWKIFARTDRLYVAQHHEIEGRPLHVVVDVSNLLAEGGEDRTIHELATELYSIQKGKTTIKNVVLVVSPELVVPIKVNRNINTDRDFSELLVTIKKGLEHIVDAHPVAHRGDIDKMDYALYPESDDIPALLRKNIRLLLTTGTLAIGRVWTEEDVQALMNNGLMKACGRKASLSLSGFSGVKPAFDPRKRRLWANSKPTSKPA